VILILSCYELGHQPHSVSLALGLLQQAGLSAQVQDLSVEALDTSLFTSAQLIAISTPMHTALRLAVSLLPTIKQYAPQTRLIFWGHYAQLNEVYLRSKGVDIVLSGEAEVQLVALASQPTMLAEKRSLPILQKLSFVTPRREQLPDLSKYARLSMDGMNQLSGYTEASRGCLHHCTHCPIPAVYDGRFFVIPKELVIQDVANQVQLGAQHITFGDPDFFNGPTHAMRILRELHRQFPQLTFDFTAKVEHLLRRPEWLPELVQLGVIFVVSAFESLSTTVLTHLKKNHTRAEIEALLQHSEAAELALRPTWVPFTPWTTLADLIELFAFTEQFSLHENIDPIQYSIRLLIPPGSLLLQDKSLQPLLGPLEQEALLYPWSHPDPTVDQLASSLQQRVALGAQAEEHPKQTFEALRALVEEVAQTKVERLVHKPKKPIPRLTEAWFC
jgi:radical SAM superfamily enzyme YgiQ (UPF0313 family)